jgi:ribonuclease PH
MARIDKRATDQIRPLSFTQDFLAHPAGSVLVAAGKTRLICAVSATSGVPRWMKEREVPGGWLTAEYQMLPAATHTRSGREVSRGKIGGRTAEIQRLIGRSLRAAVDLKLLDQLTVNIDCDVIDADGGTRCTAINGAMVALEIAVRRLQQRGQLGQSPILERIQAVSVGICNGDPVLDLCYEEDCKAEVDMNVVMTASGKFVEIQGTAEEAVFSKGQLDSMLALAESGCKQIAEAQEQAMENWLNSDSEHA